jgi:hypothetical protein
MHQYYQWLPAGVAAALAAIAAENSNWKGQVKHR